MPYTRGTIDKSLVVSCGTTNLVSICSGTSELAKQWNFADMETTMLVKCTRNSVMVCLVIFICHADTFSSYIFWAYSIFIFDFFMLPPYTPEALCFRVVHPSESSSCPYIHPTLTLFCLSVRPHWFPYLSRKTHVRNGMKFGMLVYLDHIRTV